MESGAEKRNDFGRVHCQLTQLIENQQISGDSTLCSLHSSVHQDYFLGRNSNGLFYVFIVKEKGHLLKLALDPNLRCAFWDNERSSDEHQVIYAQTNEGNILIYTFGKDGVSEAVHVSVANLTDFLAGKNKDLKDKFPVHLLTCERSYAILSLGLTHLVSLRINLLGDMTIGCVLSLTTLSPEWNHWNVISRDLSPAPGCLQQFQAVNGTIVLFDPFVCLLSIHCLVTDNILCRINLSHCGIDTRSLTGWRVSNDLSSLFLVYKDWSVARIRFMTLKQQFPDSILFENLQNVEYTLAQKYLDCVLLQRFHNYKSETSFHLNRLSALKIFSSSKKDEPNIKKTTVTGFQIKKLKSLKSKPIDISDKADSIVETLDVKEKNWTLLNAEFSKNIATLLLENKMENGTKAFCFINFNESKVFIHHLHEDSIVALSTYPSCPHLIWKDQTLTYISPREDFSNDDVISGVMSYSGPAVTDSLCQANEWTRAPVPLNTLESSLQHRQLDTLVFFFKSKQGLFSNASSRQHPSSLHIEVEHLQHVFSLLDKSVQSSMADPQGKMFAQRLLTVSLDFLYSLIEDASSIAQINKDDHTLKSEIEKDVSSYCNTLLSNVPIFREHLASLQYRGKRRGSAVGSSRTSSIASKDSIRSKSIEEVSSSKEVDVEQYIKENKVSQLQALLISEGSTSEFHYRQIIRQVFDIVKKHLEDRDISLCQSILSNLGCNVTEILWSISQFSSKRSLQQFVTNQLSSASALSHDQRKIVDFMDRLFLAYPSASFSESMKVKVNDTTSTWPDKDDPLKQSIFASDLFILSHCGDFEKDTEISDSVPDSALYMCCHLDWLSLWSGEGKQDVLTESRLLSGENLSEIYSRDPESTWRVLLSHNLRQKIRTLFDDVLENSQFPWPSNLIAEISNSSVVLQKEVLQKLLRLQKLPLNSKLPRDISIESLVATVGGPIQKPHPLAYGGPKNLSQIHNQFVKLCVSAGLLTPLWLYCNTHGIKRFESALLEEHPWLNLFQAVHKIPRYPSDKTVVLTASLLAAADLWSSHGFPVSVDEMLEKNHILAAMATLSYMDEVQIGIDPEKLQHHLRYFPKILNCLLPDGFTSGVKHTTVYELLHDNVPFDVQRLFGWHSTHILAGEDSPKVMPHFSEQKLVATHSTTQKLSFVYYLKHARPVYAFLSFLSEELDRRGGSLSVKRIEQACGIALWIACQNFNIPHVGSACVVFVEFLGRDSIQVRTMINTGRLLLAYRHRGIEHSTDPKGEQLKTCVSDIVSLLQCAVRSHRRHGHKLISELEKAIQDEIKLEGHGSSSQEASQKWMLVVLLCRLLSLPLTTKFLETCARSDNWLLFLWFAQLHQFPKHQLQTLLHGFRSPNLRDHLQYVLANAETRQLTSLSLSSSTSSSTHLSPNSQRANLYSKIGLHRKQKQMSSDEEEERKSSSGFVLSSFSSRLKHAEQQECELPEQSLPDDVFRLLFYSQSMPCQWKFLLSAAISLRNPLFAELAACCGSSAIPSLSAWLLASMSESTKQECLFSQGQQISKWGLSHLEAVIMSALSCGQEDVLVTGFSILQPKSPLLPFLFFVHECIIKGQYARSRTHLDRFKDELASWENQTDDETSISDLKTIGDRAWMEKLVYQIIVYQLKQTSTLYHAQVLCEMLHVHNMVLVFSFDVLDFGLLHKVVDILHENNVPNVNLQTLLVSSQDSQTFLSECSKATDYLISQQRFPDAHKLALVAGLPRDQVTINQINEEKKNLLSCGLWSARHVRENFWKEGTRLFKETHCSTASFSKFFQHELNENTFEREKAILCEFWLSLLEQTQDRDQAFCDDIFRNMWRHRIAAKMSLDVLDPLDYVFDTQVSVSATTYNLKEDLVSGFEPYSSVSDLQDLSTEELQVLDDLMGQYLDRGQVKACNRVAAIFGHYSQDLAISETCIGLASGQLVPSAMEPAMRRLIMKAASRRISLASVSMIRKYSVDSLDASSLEDEDNSAEVSQIIEKLCSLCDHGKQLCLRVYTCYEIAQILGGSYSDIVLTPEFDSLRDLLRVEHPLRFTLAKDFLSTSALSDEEITTFLADSVVDVLKMVVGSDTDTGMSSGVHKTWDGMEVFSQFLKLTENTSLLGDKILQSVAVLSDCHAEVTSSVLTIQTELIIMAHECYTVSSNMEGISHTLRAARICNDCLADAGEFPLMIRLLTGVGRYSEMLYVFHSLQQHHQFEILLRKGMDREDNLKVAILDYLKRYQPDDNEAYTMVALKFSMFRDIAGMLQSCGQKTLKSLQDRTPDSKDAQEILKKAFQYFQDAAESYVKDRSVRKAQTCVRMARLVSLQQQLLSSGSVVIHLNKEQLQAFISSHTRFIEALVVAQAYEWRGNWGEAIFNNVIVSGDYRYLQELRLHVHVTPSIVEDVVRRYKQAKTKPTNGLAALKKLIPLCKDAQLQYKLASDLGLVEVVTSLLKSDSGSYLQDISMI